MRRLYAAIAFSLAVAVAVLAVTVAVAQPKAHAQKNAYWPYSVETQVRDK